MNLELQKYIVEKGDIFLQKAKKENTELARSSLNELAGNGHFEAALRMLNRFKNIGKITFHEYENLSKTYDACSNLEVLAKGNHFGAALKMLNEFRKIKRVNSSLYKELKQIYEKGFETVLASSIEKGNRDLAKKMVEITGLNFSKYQEWKDIIESGNSLCDNSKTCEKPDCLGYGLHYNGFEKADCKTYIPSDSD